MTSSLERAPVVIRRYGGARLYDGARGCYVSVAELRAWAAQAIRFVVHDADTGEDVTDRILS